MTVNDERYQIRNTEIEKALRRLAGLIEEATPPGWGFGLFLVPFGDNPAAIDPVAYPAGSGKAGKTGQAAQGQGAVFWISNAERAGMVEAIRGWMDEQGQWRCQANCGWTGPAMDAQECPKCGAGIRLVKDKTT
jgi:hypothetical protein